MPRKSNSLKMALGGVFGALAIIVMLLGSIIPFATFLAPTIAGILIVPLAIEFGLRSGVLLYSAIALLSLFVVPDKEMTFFFILFFGYYPLLKSLIERIPLKLLRWMAKFALFNASVALIYSLLIFVFPIAAVVAEFEQAGIPMVGVLLVAGNTTFVIYDTALSKLVSLYQNKFRNQWLHL